MDGWDSLPTKRCASECTHIHIHHSRRHHEDINSMLMLMSRHMAIDHPTDTGDGVYRMVTHTHILVWDTYIDVGIGIHGPTSQTHSDTG